MLISAFTIFIEHGLEVDAKLCRLSAVQCDDLLVLTMSATAVSAGQVMIKAMS